jgi:hypothetical protein
MNIDLVKADKTLYPAYEEDEEKLKKIKSGEIYRYKVSKPRNLKFHKKFFALVKLGFDNSKLDFPDQDIYRYYIIMKAGHYIEVETPKGKMYLPKSISFSKMDDTEFEKVYNSVLQQIIIDTGATEEIIQTELAGYL